MVLPEMSSLYPQSLSTMSKGIKETPTWLCWKWAMVDLRGGNDATRNTCKEWTWNYLDEGCLWLNRLDGHHRNICASMSVHSMALPVPTPFVGVNTSQHPQPLRYKGLCFPGMEKAMAPHSSTPAWKIPWTEEPGGLQSMGLLRVRHNWATLLSLFTFMHWRRKWQPTPVFLPGES